MKQTIVREGHFESCHRIMSHSGKCKNLHGHSYKYELEFSYDTCSIGKNGYIIDFGDVKKIFQTFIDNHFDHSVIVNPADTLVIELAKKINDPGRIIILPQLDDNCNPEPSVENITQVLIHSLGFLSKKFNVPRVTALSVWETTQSKCRIELGNSNPRTDFIPEAYREELLG